MTMQEQIFGIQDDQQFNELAIKIFRHQAINNDVYAQYISNLNVEISSITDYKDIPFLPIQFFKSQRVVSTLVEPSITFTSSGTTGMINSQHHVFDRSWYDLSFRKAFQLFYGDIKEIALLALLPSYSERDGSSLIYMIDDLIETSEQPESNYFLYNHEELSDKLKKLNAKGTKTILIGVTYALLDFVEKHKIDYPNLIVMETGGMKGKRKEMIREELHDILCEGFGVSHIHSEYGMTELLSQGYSNGNGLFSTPPWLKILIRDTNDPLTLLDKKQTGAINVIDLANYDSCSFIATQDLGKFHDNEQFEILGRFDNADIRGCNLLVQ